MTTHQTFIGEITDLDALKVKLEQIKAEIDAISYVGPDCIIDLKTNRSFKRDFDFDLMGAIDHLDDALYNIEKYWGES